VRERAGRLLDAFLTTQLLYVAAKLGVADVLAEEDGGRFALTEVGECLRGDLAGSLRGPALVRGELYYGAAAGMLAAMQQGGTAFEQVHGDRFFDYLVRHPDHEATFQGSMTGGAEQEAGDVVAAYDFGGLGPAGRRRRWLRHPARGRPPDGAGAASRLVDRAPVVEQARQRLEAEGVAGRCELVAGDFFATVPAGADAYLLSRVLHDSADDDARRLLAGTGFRVDRMVPTGSPAGLSVIEATPAI
jgi:O-methyltransferase domain